jgi:hypothetical protein
MFEYDNTKEREQYLEESIKELDSVNKKLAKLLVRKEELTDQIIGALGHEHEGQKSYEYGVWKIEVKTPFTYSLNKKLYESFDVRLLEKYNPIKESIAYSVDKRLCEDYLSKAPDKVRALLIDLIDKKPGKAGVTLKERV